MRLLASKRWLVLIAVLLSACASSGSVVRGEDEPLKVVSSSWEEARADPSCVVPLCEGERCAVWRCQDVVQAEERPVLLAQAMPAPMAEPVPMLRTPGVGNPARWWGVPLATPTGLDPVFEIPWHNWREREREHVARKIYRLYCLRGPHEPYEKHHIFPQEMAAWFKKQGIDLHDFTIRVPRSFHQWLHSGGAKGGQWNEAWRQFISENEEASPEKIWGFAGELMSRFGVMGPFVPYYCD